MFQKQHKVKHYRSIYSSPFRGKGPKIAATVLSVVLLAAVGWFAYEPIYHLVMDFGQSSSSEIDSGAASSQPEAEGTIPSQPSGEVPTEPTPESVSLRAAYMPESVLLDAAARDRFVAMCKQKGINGILFDLKNDKGVVNFTTSVAKAGAVKAISPNAVDLRAFTAQLKQEGIQPMGRLFAFKDPLASGRDLKMAVHYGDSEWAWLDNSADLGGKPWLNPMSGEARSYLSDLVQDAARQGVVEIILDTVHFPVGYGVDLAGYGVAMPQESRSAALHSFVQEIQQLAQAENAHLSVYFSTPNFLDASGAKYGTEPAAVAGDAVVLGLMPSLFGNVYNAQSFVLESPVTMPYHTIQRVLQALPASLLQKDTIAMLQCYTASNINGLNNKVYTYADIEEQLRAIQESGITKYILYSPMGDYSLVPDQAASDAETAQ